MKKITFFTFAVLLTAYSYAQVGIGTTSPNTTLDVRGSLAANTRSFSTTTESVLITDYALLFTGTSTCTLTLPDATTCIGRIIHIKNTKTGTVPVLTISSTLSQTIDGLSSYLLDDPNESVNVVSDGSNWRIMGQSLPSGSGTYWTQGGNTVGSMKKFGTIDNYDLSLIANNTEKVRITSGGSVGIGTTSFAASNTEKLLIDGGSSTNTVVGIQGTINDFLQFNVQNFSNGNNASSDMVATANNGSDNSYYIDVGINSQGYTNSNSNILNGSNTAYLYANAADMYIGNGATGKDLIFFTNTGAWGNNTANGTERLRITSGGTVSINSGFPNTAYKLYVNGSAYASSWNTPSDRRLKTNIHTLGYGLKEIMSLQPVSYNWKDRNEGKENQLGLIAQDLRKVVPEAVNGNEQKETLSVNYTELIPVLINAVKEQQQQIEELKRRIRILENK